MLNILYLLCKYMHLKMNLHFLCLALYYYINITFCSTLRGKWSVPPKIKVVSKTKYIFSAVRSMVIFQHIDVYMSQTNAVSLFQVKSRCVLLPTSSICSLHILYPQKNKTVISEGQRSPQYLCFLSLDAWCVRAQLQNTQQKTWNSVVSMFPAWFMNWYDMINTDHIILSCGSAPSKWM